LSRRVAVTGVGLLCSAGIGTDQTWQAIRNGESGIGRITAFDPAAFSCQIAGEVKNFDPANYVEKKEVKKMGRFIQFAIAASDFALQASKLKIGPDLAERAGVYIGSGIGGFEVIEREHKTLLERGPGRISPFLIPALLSIWPAATSRFARAQRVRTPRRRRRARAALMRLATRCGSFSAAMPT
jgi:3-oxoacyl-[acyl-carrier-protein] synthase II